MGRNRFLLSQVYYSLSSPPQIGFHKPSLYIPIKGEATSLVHSALLLFSYIEVSLSFLLSGAQDPSTVGPATSVSVALITTVCGSTTVWGRGTTGKGLSVSMVSL